MSELLAGCGNKREKIVAFDKIPPTWSDDFVTLDFDETTGCDVVHDLNIVPYPFNDDRFDEVHVYEVLEHLGEQGDYRAFFNQMAEFWRILKPNGWLIGTCPNWDSVWAWGDPGHKRIITPHTLAFLSQEEYTKQVGKTAMADYRFCWECDFELYSFEESDENWAFVLRAIK